MAPPAGILYALCIQNFFEGEKTKSHLKLNIKANNCRLCHWSFVILINGAYYTAIATIPLCIWLYLYGLFANSTSCCSGTGPLVSSPTPDFFFFSHPLCSSD